MTNNFYLFEGILRIRAMMLCFASDKITKTRKCFIILLMYLSKCPFFLRDFDNLTFMLLSLMNGRYKGSNSEHFHIF